jgi:hypothetical protein
MEAAEGLEQLLGSGHLEADAIIPNKKHGGSIGLPRVPELDACLIRSGGKLPGIAEEIGQGDV